MLKVISKRHDEVEAAEERYRGSVLKYGAVESSQYWLVAYGTLVSEAETLLNHLQRAGADLRGAEREEVTKDTHRLQGIIDGWRDLARTMTKEVA